MPRYKNTLKLVPEGKYLWVKGNLNGARIRFSTGKTKEQEDEAKLEMAKYVAEQEQISESFDNKQATFNAVALNFIEMNSNKDKTIIQQAGYIEDLQPYIGNMLMSQIGARPYPRADLKSKPHILNQYIMAMRMNGYRIS